MSNRGFQAALLSLFAVGHAHAAVTAIKNVNLVDVEAGVLKPGQTIIIDGEKITAIGPVDTTKIPDDAKTIIGSNLVAMPGLFDSHVHYIHPESFGPLCIAHGVTFVRDMGGATEHILSIRDQLNKGDILGPEMIATGAIIDGVPPIWPFSIACDEPEEARAAVGKLADAGVNQIKVYSMLKKDVHKAAVEEAHSRKLKAVGHVPLSMSLTDALDAGQDGFEHLEGMCVHIAESAGHPVKEWPRSFRDTFTQWEHYPNANQQDLRKLYDRMARENTAICPTIVVMKGIGAMADAKRSSVWDDYTPAFLRSFWDNERTRRMAPGAAKTVPLMKKVVVEMHKAGVLLLCGTDLANPNVIAGHSLLEEMEQFQEAGIPAPDVLRSATIKPAKFFGVDNRLGVIAEGKTASLVLLRANPLSDVRNAREIEGVFLRGKHFDRGALQELTASVRRANKADTPKTTPPPHDEGKPETIAGEVLRKGKYRSKFQGMDAGTETFSITKAGDGFFIQGHSRPLGGMQPPCDVTVTTDRDYRVRTATYKTITETPLEAVYVRVGDKLRANASQGGAELPQQEIDFPKDAVFGGPVMITDLLSYRDFKLDVGQSKMAPLVSFGFPSWKLDTTQARIERLPDEQVVVGSQPSVAAQVYSAAFQTPMGEFASRTWYDSDGVPLKATFKMPFGLFETELEP